MAEFAGDVPLERWALSRLLVTASRLVDHDIAARLRPHGLTHAGFGVLALVQLQPISQREIAEATRVEEQTISQTVDRLERKGMVRRVRDPGDRRRYLVSATAAGERTFREATQHDPADAALGELPQAAGLRDGLIALIRAMDGERFVVAQAPADEAGSSEGADGG